MCKNTDEKFKKKIRIGFFFSFASLRFWSILNDKWNSKVGFVMAAIGSAVGLGNLWRFPYVAASHGGGAFLLPYFFAIITAGIPILMLEYTIGKTYRGGAPAAFARINKKFEWLGWVQVMISFIIFVYYLAIVVWTLSYCVFSVNQAWGNDPQGFFVKFLGVTDSAHNLGGIQTNLLIPFIIVWVIAAFAMYRGISKGVEQICRIGLPVLLVLTVILVVRGVTLPNASAGLECRKRKMLSTRRLSRRRLTTDLKFSRVSAFSVSLVLWPVRRVFL